MDIDLFYKILGKEIYLIGLFSALIIGGILKKENYFIHFYYWINSKLKNEKASLTIVSALSGIFPIEGRCTVSAPFMDSVCHEKQRSKMGVLDYIATHHYYLWSPLEPSVLIFISVLGISWVTFMQYTILPLIIYLSFLIGILVFYIDKTDIIIKEYSVQVNQTHAIIAGLLILIGLGLMISNPKMFPFYVTFPVIAGILSILSKTSIKEIMSFINWKLIFGVAAIIALGTIAKGQYSTFTDYLKMNNFTVPMLLTIGMIMAFILGSSSKYAGIGALIVSMTSLKLLPLVIICEFSGYLVSPTHKCLSISKMYFNTNMKDMLLMLGLLIILLLISSVGTYYIFL